MGERRLTALPIKRGNSCLILSGPPAPTRLIFTFIPTRRMQHVPLEHTSFVDRSITKLVSTCVVAQFDIQAYSIFIIFFNDCRQTTKIL